MGRRTWESRCPYSPLWRRQYCLYEPRYQVLDGVIVDKSLNAEVRELGKHERLGKRIEFPEYWIVIYYDSLWKDKFRKL